MYNNSFINHRYFNNTDLLTIEHITTPNN